VELSLVAAVFIDFPDNRCANSCLRSNSSLGVILPGALATIALWKSAPVWVAEAVSMMDGVCVSAGKRPASSSVFNQ